MANDAYKKRLTGFIIHGFAVAHATSAALLSQTVVGDEAVLTALTIAMIVTIARLNEKSWGVGDALAVVGTLIGWYLGTRGAMMLIKWIPGIGNAANAVTTFGVTELLGWTTYLIVKENIRPDSLTSSEKEDLRRRARNLRDEETEESKRLYNSMSDEDKREYKQIIDQLKRRDLPEETIEYLSSRLEAIAKKYA